MKVIRMAPFGDKPEDHGYVPSDLLEQIPSLMLIILKIRRFPSVEVLNDLFSKEVFDSGMSGGVCWDKFIINQLDRDDIISTLTHKYSIDYNASTDNCTAKSYDDWVSESLMLIEKK